MPAKRGNFLYQIHPAKMPASAVRFGYTWGLGGITFGLFLVLVVTGLLEMFYYVPTPGEANASVKAIAYLASYGWLVRNAHYWAGQGMVIAAALHLGRVFLTGAAKGRRRFNWLLGIALLVLTLLVDFTGYTLRWDQASHWALLVGTNLFEEIPGVGDAVYRWLVGGRTIGAATLVRFYGWHVIGLPVVMFGLMLWHFWRIRRDGGMSRPEPPPGAAVPLASRDVLLFREFVAAVIALCALVLLSATLRVGIGPAADLAITPEHVRAPWFFVGVQALLRYAPPLLAGILAPLAFLLALAALPYLEPGESGAGRWLAPERKPWLIAFGLLVGSAAALIAWGWWVA